MMRDFYVLTVDQSTSGTKAIVVDRSGRIVGRSSLDHRQLYPQPGWVEHDPLELYGNVRRAIRAALRQAGATPADIAVLTLTNQRETAVVWDRETGLPVYNAIVWQDKRTADRCAELKASGREPLVRSRTGLMLDPYFSATKLRWILDRVAQSQDSPPAERLLAGTVDSWLIWKLTGGQVHATDLTNASRTSLFDIHSLRWDEDLAGVFGVPVGMLPEVRPSDAGFGHTADPELFPDRIPISGVIGDSQGALLGQLCLAPGMAKATYGTGTSVLMNTGDAPVRSGAGLVTAIAWGLGGRTTYALEGVVRSTGDTIKWVRDNLGLFDSYEEMERLTTSVSGNEGVYLVPAFVGLGAPYWDPYARAAIVGMSRSTGKAHIVRAALESIAYQVRDAVELMQAESGVALSELRADGGASGNGWLMQFQADLLGKPVVASGDAELSALGSAFAGGLGAGFWPSAERLAELAGANRFYAPRMEAHERERLLRGWKQAVVAVCGKS